MAPRKSAGGKGGKSRKKGETEQPDVVETTLLMPESSVVQRLASAKLKLQKGNATSGGELGEKIGKAVEKDHLDRKAFSIACQFNKMLDHDPEKMAVTYFHVLRYLKDLGIPAKAEEHKGMFEADETGPGLKDKEAGAEAEGNVTHIGTAARRVAQQAGETA